MFSLNISSLIRISPKTLRAFFVLLILIVSFKLQVTLDSVLNQAEKHPKFSIMEISFNLRAGIWQLLIATLQSTIPSVRKQKSALKANGRGITL